MRKFKSGATRDSETDKIDPEAALSPLVLQAYCEYIRKHRLQSDGSVRGDDNWQKGIPVSSYMKSLWRHFLEAWRHHRGYYVEKGTLNDALFGILFNAMGMLHERLRRELDAEIYAKNGYPWLDVETGEPIPNPTKPTTIQEERAGWLEFHQNMTASSLPSEAEWNALELKVQEGRVAPLSYPKIS